MTLNKEQQIEKDKLFKEDKNLLLLWDMGTGKTFLGSNLAVTFKETTLVICPKILLENWKHNCLNWIKDKNLTCDVEVWSQSTKKIIEIIEKRNTDLEVIRETKSEEEYLKQFKRNKVIIINYEKTHRLDIENLIKTYSIKLVICDESHKIKSVKSKATLWVDKLKYQLEFKEGINTREKINTTGFEDPIRFVLMTGTPVANKNFQEYFSQVRLVADKRERIDRTKYSLLENLSPAYYKWLHYKHVVKTMYFRGRRVKKIYFSKDKINSLLGEIEDKVSHLQRDSIVVEKEVWLKQSNKKITTDLKTENLMTIRQELSINNLSQKLEYIKEEFLNKSKGTFDEPLTVFYQFKKEKELIIEWLTNKLKISNNRIVEINGQKKEIEKWKSNSITLVQTQVSEGYNILASCEKAVFITPPISSTQFLQSKGRLDRKGQLGTPVFHLVCCNKLDGKIYKIIKTNHDFTEKDFDINDI